MADLYDQLLQVAQEFMGAAADEYLRRRTRVSLGLEDPREVKPEHLDRLAEGIAITAEAYLSQERARQFSQAVLKLQRGGF